MHHLLKNELNKTTIRAYKEKFSFLIHLHAKMSSSGHPGNRVRTKKLNKFFLT